MTTDQFPISVAPDVSRAYRDASDFDVARWEFDTNVIVSALKLGAS